MRRMDIGGSSFYYDADMDIGRNVLRRVEVIEVDDSGEIQMVRLMGLADEVFEMPLRGQNFGRTAVPTKGSIGYVLMANGRPDQAFGLQLEDPEIRPRNLKPGEVQTYAKEKQRILMDAKGDQHIDTPKGIVYINT